MITKVLAAPHWLQYTLKLILRLLVSLPLATIVCDPWSEVGLSSKGPCKSKRRHSICSQSHMNVKQCAKRKYRMMCKIFLFTIPF